VFTHAWALRSDQWNYQIPALVDAGLRCITYDRRGHGRSECPSTGYDLDTLADDLASVIEQQKLQGITLVGHSIGCREIVRYLSRHGDARVARAVFVGTNTPLLRRTDDNPDGWDPALIDANTAAVAADVPKWCADFERLGPYFGSSPGGSPGLVDWTIRLIVDTPLQVLLETLRTTTPVDMRAEVARINVPTLLIHGDADASAPINLTGRRTAALIPGARLIEYAGAGHGLYASDHQRLNDDLIGFIRGPTAAKSGQGAGVAVR
jgi:pimeloyl-ACP methyl ester carboxylesterase